MSSIRGGMKQLLDATTVKKWGGGGLLSSSLTPELPWGRLPIRLARTGDGQLLEVLHCGAKGVGLPRGHVSSRSTETGTTRSWERTEYLQRDVVGVDDPAAWLLAVL